MLPCLSHPGLWIQDWKPLRNQWVQSQLSKNL
uniref:RNA polymerase II C-terminal domain phosphatase-like 1 n=1 Tax=Rhizophora mucronata TaxID=61149 RepID=A0A2P2LPT4_RHIMU